MLLGFSRARTWRAAFSFPVVIGYSVNTLWNMYQQELLSRYISNRINFTELFGDVKIDNCACFRRGMVWLIKTCWRNWDRNQCSICNLKEAMAYPLKALVLLVKTQPTPLKTHPHKLDALAKTSSIVSQWRLVYKNLEKAWLHWKWVTGTCFSLCSVSLSRLCFVGMKSAWLFQWLVFTLAQAGVTTQADFFPDPFTTDKSS